MTPAANSLRTRPLTQFQGMVIAVFTFLLLLAFSIPLTVAQYNLDQAQSKLAATDASVCQSRQNIVREHNELAQKMAQIERADASHSTQQREQTAQAWEDSLLPPPPPC